MTGAKRILVLKYSSKDDKEPEPTEGNNVRKVKWKNQEEALKNEEDIAESGRIFARNLSYTITVEDIENLFNKFGKFLFYLIRL